MAVLVELLLSFSVIPVECWDSFMKHAMSTEPIMLDTVQS